MKIKLNSCPICHRLPKLFSLEPEFHSNKYFCGTHVSCGDWKRSEEEAAIDWNLRTQDSTQPDLYKPTNSEYLHGMSDEELTIFLASVFCAGMAAGEKGDDFYHSFSWTLDWFNQPFNEEES